jgi:hypothetical protein
MSADITAVYTPDPAAERRTLLLGNRLALSAVSMLQLAMLFAYLFLRGNNFGGSWRPDGIADLSGIPVAIVLVLQLACLLAVLSALGAVARGSSARAIVGVALLLAVAAIAVRWWLQYHLGDGWVINTGTYASVSMLWFALLLVQALLGGIWLLSLVVPGPRAHDPLATSRHLRAFAEYWGYLLGLSTLVWLLVRLV